MNMSSGIRVRTDRKLKRLFGELCDVVFPQKMHELFFLCACVGYRSKKAKSLGRDGEERFWSDTITPEEYVCYYSMLLAEKDMNIASIRDDREVIRRVEEYANAGLGVLLDSFLVDFVVSIEGECSLDPSHKELLPKMLLSYVQGEMLATGQA